MAAVPPLQLAPAERASADWSGPVAELMPRRPRTRWWSRFLRSKQADEAQNKYIELVERLERAVHGSSDGLWEWDFRTGRVWIMPQLAALLEKTVEQLPMQIEQWWDEIHPDDLAGLQNALYRHRDFGDPFERQFRIRTSSGAYRWFRNRGLAYRDENGKALVMAGSICDVDDLFRVQQSLRDKEAQLLQQQKIDAIGSLAGGVAHEFNNLLQAIRGYASFAREASSDPQQESDLDRVLETCDRATTFTRQLLDFSRKESAEPGPCSCDALLGDLQALLKPLLPLGVELTIQQSAAGRAVHANERLLQQALLNLCINACDAMPDGGRLLVRSETYTASAQNAAVHPNLAPGEYERILVTDTGCGVSAEAAERLFQPFFTTKLAGRGTGLGLSTAVDIVTQSGGWMDFFSTPGHGTTFRVYLPVSYDDAPTDESPAAEAPPRLEATILLADAGATGEVGQRMLEHAGCKVLAAKTGDEAMTLFHERLFEIDAIVLDLAIPGLSCRDALEQIRDVSPEMPVCVCTGYDPAASQFDALRAAGCGIVEKPFDGRRLLLALKSVMSAATNPVEAAW